MMHFYGFSMFYSIYFRIMAHFCFFVFLVFAAHPLIFLVTFSIILQVHDDKEKVYFLFWLHLGIFGDTNFVTGCVGQSADYFSVSEMMVLAGGVALKSFAILSTHTRTPTRLKCTCVCVCANKT